MRLRDFRQMLALLATGLLVGCGAPSDSPQQGAPDAVGPDGAAGDAGTLAETGSHADAGGPDAGCRPEKDLRSVYDRSVESLRTLDTTGRLQIRSAGQLAFRLLLANRDLYDGTAREQLSSLLQFAEKHGLYEPYPEMRRNDRGEWMQQFANGANFEMQFFGPGGAAIKRDVFDFDSYLKGLRINYDMSFAEMQQYPERKNTWTISWDERGPLYHLLGGDVSNPFVVHASLRDLARLAAGAGVPKKADLGPVRALFDLRMESTLRLESASSRQVTVELRAEGRRRSVRQIVTMGRIGYDVTRMRASNDVFALQTDSPELEATIGGLSGTITYTIEGPTPGYQQVTSTYRHSSSPSTTWTCR